MVPTVSPVTTQQSHAVPQRHADRAVLMWENSTLVKADCRPPHDASCSEPAARLEAMNAHARRQSSISGTTEISSI